MPQHGTKRPIGSSTSCAPPRAMVPVLSHPALPLCGCHVPHPAARTQQCAPDGRDTCCSAVQVGTEDFPEKKREDEVVSDELEPKVAAPPQIRGLNMTYLTARWNPLPTADRSAPKLARLLCAFR